MSIANAYRAKTTGVYCGIGAHDLCLKPRCSCICHHGGPSSLVEQQSKLPRGAGRKATPVLNDAGQRVCEECKVTVLVRKDPQGRGRFPRRCEECKAKS